MLLKHYWVDRDDINVFALTQEQYQTPLFGTIAPNIPGLEIIYRLTDENDIAYCLSTCPDDSVIPEAEGITILTQEEWDEEIAAYDARQESKRLDIVRKYRNTALTETDWIVIKALETGTEIPEDVKVWRQALRDLPEETPFPVNFPATPEEVSISFTNEDYQQALRTIPMINDPVPAPPEPEESLD
jgi:hypothetical protein